MRITYEIVQEEEAALVTQNRILDRKINTYKLWAQGFIVFGIICAGIGLYHFIVNPIFDKQQMSFSELGSYLSGAVATSWSLSGLLLVYIAFLGQQKQILLQRIDLKYNRLELQSTVEELEGQKLQLELQNKTLMIQSFENSFFNLLTIQKKIVDNIYGEVRTSLGRRKFNSYAYLFQVEQKISMDLTYYSNVLDRINVSQIVNGELKNQSKNISHYFKHLLHTLKYIDENDIDNKQKYFDLLNAQLDEIELRLLFYYSISDLGEKVLRPLICKHDILKNLDKRQNIIKVPYSIFYSISDNAMNK